VFGKEMYFKKVKTVAMPIFFAAFLALLWVVFGNSLLSVFFALIILLIFTVLSRQDYQMYDSIEKFQKEKNIPKTGELRKVLVLEGFSGNNIEDVVGNLLKGLKKMGLEVVPIEHMPQKGIVQRLLNAKTIEEFAIAAYPQFANLRNCDIVIGYSMGCLVARFVLEVLGIKANPTVILVGGPHRGCNWKYAPLFLVPCIREMLPKSSFLEKLGLPKNKLYWYIIAEDDKKVSMTSACPVENGQCKVMKGGHRMINTPEFLEEIEEIINPLSSIKTL